MDYSAKNIKMCKQAKEIQERWEYKNGDFFIDDRGCLFVLGDAGINSSGNIVAFSGQEIGLELNKCIWIPRQDQLQDMMVGNKFAYQWQRLSSFIASSPVPCSYFDSWEQLWLAFVMNENYRKSWEETEQKWVEIVF